MTTFEEFAKVDLYVGDIDPVYWAIARAVDEFGYNWATRFSVAMLVYYHTGTAVQAAEYPASSFWDHLEAIFDSAPRGTERRHARGANGKAMLASMRAFSPAPEDFFKRMPNDYWQIKRECENKLHSFGPYFQLKIADYMGCLEHPVYGMHRLGENLPTLPSKAVRMIYPELTVQNGFYRLCERVDKLCLLAQPHFDRPIGPAEVETILCDWKRAKTGSSWMGADVLDKRTALRGYGIKADMMAEWMPPTIAKDTFILELE